jgi:hypothetical protein
MEANASRYHGEAPDEIKWAELERQTRAVRKYLAALEAVVEPRSQATEGDIVERSLLSVDRQGQQAGAVRLRAQFISSTSRTRSLST